MSQTPPKHHFLECSQYETFRISLLRELQTLLLPNLFQKEKKILDMIIQTIIPNYVLLFILICTKPVDFSNKLLYHASFQKYDY